MAEPFTVILVHELAGKVVDTLADGALERLVRRRLDGARDVLQRRMRKGQVWAWTEDATASALFTYMRAAQEGAAQLNLELMADAMVNGAAEGAFAPDVFRRHSAALATLSRDEALFLVALMAVRDAPQEPGSDINAGYRLRSDPAAFGLPPSIDVDACSQGLTRTGWVMLQSLYGALGFDLTASFTEVRRLVDFQVALSAAAGRRGDET